MEKKYSVVEQEINGYTYVVAYPNEYGVESICGLELWVADDPANRNYFTAESEDDANELLNTFINAIKDSN